MNVDDLVVQYTKIALEEKGSSDEELFSALCNLGFPAEQVSDAVRMIPIAFARKFLDGMGIVFSDHYWVFSPIGKEEASGTLATNPVFVAASMMAHKLLTKSVGEKIVFRSSEVNAVNQLLNSGSKPEDLKLAPVVFFNGSPTAIGLESAQARIREFFQSEPRLEAVFQEKRPWWRLWQ